MRRSLAFLPLAVSALLLAGCVPPAAPHDESPSPSVSETPTEEPTDEAVDAVIPDLGGSELFTVDAVATYDGGRYRLVLTAYVPIETGTAEGQQIDAYLAQAGDDSGVYSSAVAAEGSLQLLKLEVEGLDGDWPADLTIPMSAGLPGLSTIVDIPSSNDAFYSNVEGSGSGWVVAALSGDAPVTVFDWDKLDLRYGFDAAGPVGFDACDITTTDRATSYAGLASWVEGFCTFGVE